LKNLLYLSVLALAHVATGATPAQYYNEGATNFVHKELFRAKAAVSNGLALFPNDVKLQGLHDFLNKQQQQQQQQQQDQQQQEQEKKDQKDQQSQQNQENQQQQQEKEKKEQQEREQQQKPSDKQDQSQQQKPAEGDGQKEKKEGGEGAAAQQLLQMTPEQAQRLLEAAKSEEKVMIFTPQLRTNRNNRVLKDW
jgi:outer membrane biosynthesis protein TonB